MLLLSAKERDRLVQFRAWILERPRDGEACGELALMDNLIRCWLEDRSDEPIALIALVDDATGRATGRFIERDTDLDNRTAAASGSSGW